MARYLGIGSFKFFIFRTQIYINIGCTVQGSTFRVEKIPHRGFIFLEQFKYDGGYVKDW